MAGTWQESKPPSVDHGLHVTDSVCIDIIILMDQLTPLSRARIVRGRCHHAHESAVGVTGWV